jgi:hypothetical protein
MQIGRKELFTDYPEVTYENIIPILRDVFPNHQENANRINFLLEYDAGNQPITRVKKYRPDIDCKCVDNVANEVSKFHISFKWGNPITFVQRGERDSGTENEPMSVCLLNECYESEEIRKKTQKLSRFVEIGGIGYTYVDVNTDYEDGDSFFKIEALDPRTTFIVRSSYYFDQRIMIGVTYRTDKHGNKHFTCFTKDLRFEILNLTEITNGKEVNVKNPWKHKERSGEENPIHAIPIIEWFRSYDRMGCFERQISEMDNLNLLISDFTNDVEQNTQALWHSNDVEFPKETVKNEDGTETEVVRKPKSGEWMQTFTPQDGKTPIVEALSINYDYDGMLNNITTRRALILQKCNVPSRSDNSGGSTGIAMDSAVGWDAAEIEANQQQNIMESCKMEEVKVVLKAIRLSPDVSSDSPLLKLRYTDVQPSIKRQKNFELTTKINFFATAVSHGIYGLHALKAMNAFEDVAQVWEDSRSLIEAYQRSVFNKSETSNNAVGADGEEKPNSDRLLADESDQTENSPNLRG